MQYKIGLGVVGVSLLVLVTSITGSFGWGVVEGIFGGIGVFAGVMMVLGDRPETKRAARLRHSMSANQWDLYQNRSASRAGWGIAGVSLLVVIISSVAWNSLPGMIGMLGLSFGGAGVLSGIIVAVAYRYEGLKVAGRPIDDRHAGIANALSYSGMAATVFALAAGLGELSWPIVGVAVTLGTFQVWAMFWGPRGGSFLALRGIIQLVLFGVFFYAVFTHGHHRHSFNRRACPSSACVWLKDRQRVDESLRARGVSATDLSA
jgi:hypothetical protein